MGYDFPMTANREYASEISNYLDVVNQTKLHAFISNIHLKLRKKSFILLQ
jgi:hypothetical protein